MRLWLALFAFAVGLFAIGCGGDSADVVTPSPVKVNLNVSTVKIAPLSSYGFTANVSGVSNTQVRWSVVGGDVNGTVSDTGRYVSPGSTGTYQVVATSVADPAIKATATVIVQSGVNIALSPQNVTAKVGTDVAFNATITGSSNSGVTYQTFGQGSGGVISEYGVFTAPDTPGTYEVLATSVADPTQTARTKVTVIPGVAVQIQGAPSAPVCMPGSSLALSAKVTGASNKAVTWSVRQSGGGTVDVDGDYTTPSTPGTYTVRATSTADVSEFAELQVVVTSSVQARVTVKDKGDFVMHLATAEAPNTSKNLVNLANRLFYDGIIFHRYEANFVIQGGDPLTKTLPLTDPSIGTGGPGYTIDFEPNALLHKHYSLGMARATALNSAGSQWYICLQDLPGLDGDYVVFGQVTSGQSIVDSLRVGDVIEKLRIEVEP